MTELYIKTSAVKGLIASKISFCIICVCALYIYYVYINTHTCMYIYFRKMLSLYEYKYRHVNTCKYFQNVYCMYEYLYTLYIHIINIHRTHTYIMQTKTFILYAINRLTAQIKTIISRQSIMKSFTCGL